MRLLRYFSKKELQLLRRYATIDRGDLLYIKTPIGRFEINCQRYVKGLKIYEFQKRRYWTKEDLMEKLQEV